MTIYSYEQLQSGIADLASKRAIVPQKTGRDLINIRIQPSDVVRCKVLEPRSIQLFARVSIETGGRAGLPQRAYLRIQALKSRNGESGELRISPGWPRAASEILLDVLWYGMILFPATTFLVRFAEQPTQIHGLAFFLFLFLFIADRIAVGLLYRRGKEKIDELLAGGVGIVDSASTPRTSKQVQDWIESLEPEEE